MIVLIITVLVVAVAFAPGFDLVIVVQQILRGIRPVALVCIPMFILAANIITQGEAADRLVNLVKSYLGHIRGGLPIVTNACCTLFGAVSGSTQATVAAIGQPLRPMLLKSGYSSSFSLALIINSSDIAYLIPPSIGAIVYGVANKVSIGQLFLAGIGPGLLIFVMFSIFCLIYSRRKKIAILPKASWGERLHATKGGILLLGFPIIIMGGIYGGIFTPTEASAVAVLYALLLEGLIYRKLTFEKFKKATLETGVITTAVFILIGAGQALSWLISYFQIPQAILPHVFGSNPSALAVIGVVLVSYFVACMFVAPVVAIFILSPVFAPYVAQAGIDQILLGTLVVLQGAIGSATPPFGCDIFTAQLIFRRPYWEIIRETPPFIAILLAATLVIIFIPDIALFLPTHALR